MAKFIKNDASGVGLIEEATIGTSAGAGDAGKVPHLDGDGRLATSMMPVGVGSDTKVLVGSEALSAANLVNIWNDSGTAKARKADATSAGKEANGYVLASSLSGANATVYAEQIISGLSGLTPGAYYYLSTTPGAITTTKPTGSGNVVQGIGRALSATELQFLPTAPLVLA